MDISVRKAEREKKVDPAQEYERLVPVLCVRIFQPNGKCLVRTARNDSGVGLENIREIMGTEMQTTYANEWPGRACPMPDDIFALAEIIAAEQVNIPQGSLKLSMGGIDVSESEPDRYLTCQSRYIRHFVNAQMVEPVPEDLSEELGLAKGEYVFQRGNSVEYFQWWDVRQCDEKLPGGASSAQNQLVSSGAIRDSVVAGLFEDLVVAEPWAKDSVDRVLRQHGVDLKAAEHGLHTSAAVAEQLQSSHWALVRRKKKSKSTSKGGIAVLNGDGQAYFFPSKSGSDVA